MSFLTGRSSRLNLCHSQLFIYFAESVEQDQTVHTCSLILLYTSRCLIISFCEGNSHPIPLTLFQTSPVFLRVFSISLLKTLWEKEKLLVTSNFSFFPQCFLPRWKIFYHFHPIQNCHLQTLSVWESLKFVVWERVKPIETCSYYREQSIYNRKANGQDDVRNLSTTDHTCHYVLFDIREKINGTRVSLKLVIFSTMVMWGKNSQ